jgi:alanine-synthesizing transaminase
VLVPNRTTVFSGRSSFERSLNPLARALEELRRQGRSWLDLTVSNPTRAGLPYAKDALTRALGRPEAVDYAPEPFGLPAARAAVAAEVVSDGIRVSADDVVLTASTSEAYGFAFKLLCDAGDEILVPAPSYPLLDHLASLEQVRLRQYALAYDGAWHVDIESLRRCKTERSRAVVVVNPNNPTGSYLKQSELDVLAELGLPVISDEVFSRYPLTEDAARVTSVLALESNLVIALGGLSKLAALPQHKLAWMLLGGPSAARDEARGRLEIIADAYLSVGAVVQHALPDLLRESRATADAIRVRAREGLARIREILAGSSVSVLHVEGGWYAVLRWPRVATEEAWVVGLLEQEGVLVQPGWFFDFPDEPHCVISLLTPPDVLGEGVTRLRRHAG